MWYSLENKQTGVAREPPNRLLHRWEGSKKTTRGKDTLTQYDFQPGKINLIHATHHTKK